MSVLKSNGAFYNGINIITKIIQKHLLHGEMKAGEEVQSALIRR